MQEFDGESTDVVWAQVIPERPAVTSSRFFEPSKLSGLERMRFTTRRRVEGAYSGRHVAKRRGGSGEFADHREYSPGDDLRRLDWKAMGRTGRSYLKLFQDETDLQLTMLLDCSGSMRQGGRSMTDLRGSKIDWTKYFATALSHLVVLGRDAVGLGIIREGLAGYLSPASSMQHRALIHQMTEQMSCTGKTDLAKGLDDLLLRSTRRGALLVISDFLVPALEPVVAGVRKFRARGWEVIALHVLHPDEQQLPEGSAFRFIGQEGDGTLDCQVSQLRREYERRFSQHMATTRNGLVAAGCDYHVALTSTSYLDVLRSFLVLRSA